MFRTQNTKTNTVKGYEQGKGSVGNSLFFNLKTSPFKELFRTQNEYSDHHSFIVAAKRLFFKVSQIVSLLGRALLVIACRRKNCEAFRSFSKKFEDAFLH